jgi:hypothetical protein
MHVRYMWYQLLSSVATTLNEHEVQNCVHTSESKEAGKLGWRFLGETIGVGVEPILVYM